MQQHVWRALYRLAIGEVIVSKRTYRLSAIAVLLLTGALAAVISSGNDVEEPPDPAPAALLRHALAPNRATAVAPTPTVSTTSTRPPTRIVSSTPSTTELITPPFGPTGTVSDAPAGLAEPSPSPTLRSIGSVSGSALIPTPTPSPTPVPTNRLIIRTIGVDARVDPAGIDVNNVMETPSDPYAVAWYTFSATPGTAGNAVFSGHVDHVTAGRSIFWNLRFLEVGDAIEYRTLDGVSFYYRVMLVKTVSASDPANDYVGPSSSEIVTVITCSGSFDRSNLSYDERLIVQAVREYR